MLEFRLKARFPFLDLEDDIELFGFSFGKDGFDFSIFWVPDKASGLFAIWKDRHVKLGLSIFFISKVFWNDG